MANNRPEIYSLPETNELIRIIECPICNDIPLPPIYSCENGHIMCTACTKKFGKCGLCKGKTLTTRNYPLEAIVNSSKFKCKYELDGCTEIITGDIIKEHVKICDFRSVICNHSSKNKCNNKIIPLRNFIKHLTEEHNILYKELSLNTGFEIALSAKTTKLENDAKWPLILVKAGDDGWFFRKIEIREGLFMIWITILANERVAEKYKATVSIYSKTRKLPPVESEIPVYSFRSPPDTTVTSSCAAIPIVQLKMIADYVNEGIEFEWGAKYLISTI